MNGYYENGYKITKDGGSYKVEYGNSPEHYPYSCDKLQVNRLSLKDKLKISNWKVIYDTVYLPIELINIIFNNNLDDILNIKSQCELVGSLKEFNKKYRKERVFHIINQPSINVKCACGRSEEHICNSNNTNININKELNNYRRKRRHNNFYLKNRKKFNNYKKIKRRNMRY